MSDSVFFLPLKTQPNLYLHSISSFSVPTQQLCKKPVCSGTAAEYVRRAGSNAAAHHKPGSPRPSVLICKHCFPSSDQRGRSVSVLHQTSLSQKVWEIVFWPIPPLRLVSSLDFPARSPHLFFFFDHLKPKDQNIPNHPSSSDAHRSDHRSVALIQRSEMNEWRREVPAGGACQVCWQQARAGRPPFCRSYSSIMARIGLSSVRVCRGLVGRLVSCQRFDSDLCELVASSFKPCSCTVDVRV